MFPMCLPVSWQPACLKGLDDLRHLFIREEYVRLSLDIGDVSSVHHVRRHCCLECAVAPKHHDGVESLMRKPQELGERPGVTIVLARWVLKASLLAVEKLRPLRLFLVSEDPAVHVLGLNHKDAEARDKHMIDLRSPAIR